MGYGGYSGDAHAAILTTRSTLRDAEVFTQVNVHALMDPKGVSLRESRDSEIHPNSVPIVFALDVTGSMRHIPKSIARDELPTFMQEVLNRGVEDPQIMFLAVGDANTDNSPIQVGQYESAAQQMDQWLTMCHLEGGGGGNGGESYELAAYFLARHTETDSFEKRGRKGYVFFTGDDYAFPLVSASQVRRLFGDSLQEDIRTTDIFAELRKKYEVFFLIPRGHGEDGLDEAWRVLLGDHVVRMESEGDTCLVTAAIVALNEGKVTSLPSLADEYTSQGFSKDRVGAIVRALTPFSETLQKSGMPLPVVTEPTLPVSGRGTPHQRRAARSAK